VTGLWRAQVVPRIVDLALRSPPATAARRRACAGLAGEVLEIGFGSGLNAPHYPAAVTRVLAVEPSDVAWRLASRRLGGVDVQRVGLDGERVPLPDASADCALSTWTLCTIPDPVAALREVARVLRPGGRLHFVEHGLSPDPRVARWQHRLQPLQYRLAGGCHLQRPVDRLLDAAGMRVERLENRYEPGAPKPLGYLYEGVAAPA
jgi:ubiquinone/menaquinone biosynthesis C-methylase UbiE